MLDDYKKYLVLNVIFRLVIAGKVYEVLKLLSCMETMVSCHRTSGVVHWGNPLSGTMYPMLRVPGFEHWKNPIFEYRVIVPRGHVRFY